MSVTFRPAKRESVGLLIGLAGASGSGKSFSALRLARGLAGDKPFAVIDTEARRMLHYADRFQPWEHAELEPPFTPARYAEAIKTADEAGYPVIVVDSASHEHAGEGGLLDMFDEDFAKAGHKEARRMSCWIRPKMEHKRFVSRLLQVRAHLILCFRAEEKVEIVREGDKTVVRPKQSLTGLNGWLPVCEKNLPFELTLSLLLTPDAPGLPKPIKLQDQHRPFLPLDQPITEQTGVELQAWAAGDAKPSGRGRRVGAGDSEAPMLTTELLELAAQLGKRDQVATAIATHRRGHSTKPAAHLSWLRKQLENAQSAVSKQTQTDIDFDADSAPTDNPPVEEE